MPLQIRALVIVLSCAAFAGARAAVPASYDAPLLYDGVAKSSQYLASFDGTRVAVSVWRPTRGGQVTQERLPVIVTQQRNDGPQIRYFVQRGYVWVGQDRRGTGASFGQQTGFVNRRDAQDARAVIEWAGAQPFSSGKVVGYGCSNQGAWQFVVAALAPKHLVALAPACSSAQFFDDAVVINGVPMFQTRASAFAGECTAPQPGERQSGGTPRSTEPVDEDHDGALLRAAKAAQNCNATMLGQYWLDMPRDGRNAFDDYLPGIEDSALAHAAAIRKSGIAILQLGGWFDAAGPGQMASQAYWGGRVIMGPWVHGNRAPAGAQFPNDTLDVDAEILRWFDYHAKGARNGADKPGVLYYTINAPAGREWRTADRWRWSGERKVSYYFGADALGRVPGKAMPITYQGRDVDLFDGRYQSLGRYFAGDMSPVDAQSLSQTAPPFTADVEVTGTPTVRAWISADTADTNLFALLEDVGPDGKSTFVTDGRVRASWRRIAPSPWGVREQLWHRGFAADIAPLRPGEVAELAFNLNPVSYVFRAGHRLRVSLATSIGQTYQQPPLARGKAPILQLYRDRAHPSAIELPTMRQASSRPLHAPSGTP